MGTGIEIAVARTLAKPTFDVIKTGLGKAFSTLEEERLRKALAAAVADVAPPSPKLRRRYDHFMRTRDAKKELEKERTTSKALLAHTSAATAAGGVGSSPFDWRSALGKQLENTMRTQQNAGDGDWIDFLNRRSPEAWGAAVARAFELRMAGDDRLRPLLARLDWGDRQAVHIVVANSLDDMRTALWRIVFALGLISTGIAELVDKT